MSIIIYLLITMAFSAFFSGMEIAFVSVDKLRFEMDRKGGVSSRILSLFFRNPNDFISTMLVGNNIALVIYGILMAQIIGDNLLAGWITNHFVMVLVQSSIDNAESEETLDTEVKIFQNALDFSAVKIRDCIVPRTEVVAVALDTSLEELKGRFVESGISKIIVYDGNIDNVVGYIHSSEMFRSPKDWRDHVKEVPIVPETMAAHKLMKLFMQQKKTIAVVVDEFGGTSGIVSLEDLVEEIFGDIEDEHDNTSYICKQIGEHEYVLSARLEIEKVNETFN